AKPWHGSVMWPEASAGEGRSEKDMRKGKKRPILALIREPWRAWPRPKGKLTKLQPPETCHGQHRAVRKRAGKGLHRPLPPRAALHARSRAEVARQARLRARLGPVRDFRVGWWNSAWSGLPPRDLAIARFAHLAAGSPKFRLPPALVSLASLRSR